MLNLDEGKKAVIFARKIVENFVKDSKIPVEELTAIFITSRKTARKVTSENK